MATATKNFAESFVLQPNGGIVKILRIATKAAILLCRTGRVEVTCQIPGREKIVNFLESDGEISENLQEIESFLHSVEGWQKISARSGKPIIVTMSAE